MTQTADNLPQLGLTLFSLTLEMRHPGYTLEGMIDRVAELDLGPGLEMVGFQSIRNWPRVTPELVRSFREQVERLELVPSAMSMNLDVARRRDRFMTEEEGLEYLEAQMFAAKQLGFPIGKSAIIYSKPFIEGLARICERLDMQFGVEIHSPDAVDSPTVTKLRELYEEVGSDRLGFIPDFSSSMHDLPPTLLEAHRQSGMSDELIALASEVWHSHTTMPEKFGRFAQEAPALGATEADMGKLNMVLTMHGTMDARRWSELMDRTIHVHGKFYGLDEHGNEPSIDHAAIMDVLLDAGYTGFISSEWEGHAYTDHVSGWDMVRGQQDLLARLLLDKAGQRA